MIYKFYNWLFICNVLLLFSCSEKESKQANTYGPKVVEAKGYLVPKDSMAEPKVIFVDESKLKKIQAGKPIVVPTNTNIHPAGIPKIVIAGKPRVCIPGQDTFSLPKKVLAKGKTTRAGIPQVVVVKDAYVKDQNSQNFSTFNILQGLKQSTVRVMLEDKNRNLWFGTHAGGVSKYDGKSFTTYTNKEGLPNNNVWSILEDQSGNIWFGTFGGGVSKYDGKSFTSFTDEEGLANNNVISILEDKSGNIWFGTMKGVSKYDGKFFTTFTDKEGLASNVVASILEDKIGNIWFGTTKGASKYDGNSFTNFTDKEGLVNNDVLSILEDKSGHIWFGTLGGGVSKYDGEFFTTFTDKEGLVNNNVSSILEDQNGNMWFGTLGGGISKYDGKLFATYTDKEGLVDNNVMSIIEDKNGNLWFGTANGGVSKYDGKLFTTFTDKEGLANGNVLSILEDKSGNMWFGTRVGVSKYDGKSFATLTHEGALFNNTITSIIEDKSGDMWFGSIGEGVSKYDGKSFITFTSKEGLLANSVWSILEDKRGNIWFGTDFGGISKYDGNSFTTFSGLAQNIVQSILEDKKGNIWFGTDGDGVLKYDGKSFTTFTEKEGFPNNTVQSILEDKSGNIWFGTREGISKYDGKSFTTFTDKEGLVNNNVMSITEDRGGTLWFGTRFGLSKLTRLKLAEITEKINSNTLNESDVIFKNYTYDDGFLGVGVNRGKTMCQSKDGTIWIGAKGRLTAMHPEGIYPDTIAPNIQLTDVQLFNENINWISCENKKDTSFLLGNGVTVSNFKFNDLTKYYLLPEHLNLTYDNNYLTFNFIGITMGQPKKVKYQYKLEGIDKNWSAITTRNDAPYGNITPGTYTFKVKAMNSEGYWSNDFNYPFTIRPPWWQTWLAYASYVLIVVTSIWLFINWRTKSLKKRQKELEATVKERTAEVVEQKAHVEEKQKEILDSINYAKRIQQGLFSQDDSLSKNLDEYFLLFKPKDIVSGDFYWSTKRTVINNGKINRELIYVAVCDSTGHGVPGAFMSLLNTGFLSEAIKEKRILKPNEIFNHIRNRLIETVSQDGGQDGMDGILICINNATSQITYAAANNQPVLIRDGKSIELAKDKMPVGKGEKLDSFNLYTIDVQKGDCIYLYTDGYADQFGGPNQKKFKYKPLDDLLISISDLPMDKQKTILNDTFENWKGDLEQVDDVCIVGIKI